MKVAGCSFVCRKRLRFAAMNMIIIFSFTHAKAERKNDLSNERAITVVKSIMDLRSYYSRDRSCFTPLYPGNSIETVFRNIRLQNVENIGSSISGFALLSDGSRAFEFSLNALSKATDKFVTGIIHPLGVTHLDINQISRALDQKPVEAYASGHSENGLAAISLRMSLFSFSIGPTNTGKLCFVKLQTLMDQDGYLVQLTIKLEKRP